MSLYNLNETSPTNESLSSHENGSTLIIFTVCLTLLLCVISFVLDLGRVYVTKQQMQAAADFGALSVAMELNTDEPWLLRSQVPTIVSEITSLNMADSATYLLDLVNNTISVTAYRQIPATFSKILGHNYFNVPGTAKAALVSVGELGNLFPIAVEHPPDGIDSVHDWLNSDDVVTLYDTYQEGSGSFGWVDYGGLENSVSALVDIINDPSLSGVWKIDDQIPSMTGVKVANATNEALDGVIAADGVLFFPVYKAVTDSGGNLVYTIGEFAAFKLLSYDLTGNPKSITGTFVDIVVPGAVGGGPIDSRVKTIRLIE